MKSQSIPVCDDELMFKAWFLTYKNASEIQRLFFRQMVNDIASFMKLESISQDQVNDVRSILQNRSTNGAINQGTFFNLTIFEIHKYSTF